jgi:O-antigen/teichoic acid export membrane protein
MSTDSSPPGVFGLRSLVLRGGTLLFGRQVASMCLSLIGLVVITRFIGPESYGAYTAALVVVQSLQISVQNGVSAYLIRQAGEVPEREYCVASTFLLALSLLLAFGIVVSADIAALWVQAPGFAALLRTLALVMPFQSLATVAGARIDRALNFRQVTLVELSTQIAYYVVAVPLALFGLGAWSLVFAWVVQQICACALLHVAAKYVFSFAWDSPFILRMIHYSFQVSVPGWLAQLRTLAKTMILGHFLGAEAVAYVGFAARLLDLLTVAKNIGWRVSLAAFGRIQSQPEKLKRAINEAMQLQTLAIGPMLLAFSWIGGPILLAISGERWSPVNDLFPYLALSYLANAQFNMHISALLVLDRNLRFMLFSASYSLITVLACAAMIPYSGLIGYGWAEIAGLPAYLILHFAVVPLIGHLRYRVSLVWATGIAIGLFWRQLGWWAIPVPFLALLFPESIRQIRAFMVAARIASGYSR